ncbi:MAG: DUF1565 domain-containing protein, partial [Phycisphaerae bacterium]|nr:DUF1565 domain-containing protein [Phycisphaerae bacterium]NIR94070.1 DUF1565 domain-containing protein [Gammaproteobacteria bacterium]NIU56810.1 DUF1565 domain-containing protein [Phycisphaerae bacterium]NIW98963.1 DUF1565 domain-containing protein [Phycisphaerae bacterium]
MSPKVLGAEMIYVNGENVGDPLEDGSLEHPYNTIQEGVNAASVGGTVQVASGTYYENVVINKSLTLKGAGSDITIIDGSGPLKPGVEITGDNVNISRFTIRNSGHGVHLHMCSGTTVSDNTMTSNKYEGIYVQASNDNTICGNIITSNKFEGMYLETSTGNKISGNTIINNGFDGVFLDSSSDSNTVSDNTITSHVNWTGIGLSHSGGNTISNNTLSINYYGIGFYDLSIGNTASGNTISNNELGIELYESGGSTIYHNNFINNTDQVYPSGTNAWDNGVEGNYWIDYNGTDADSDGIGDIPYEIDVTNKDNHPLMNPYDKTNPIADAGPDQLVVNGTTVTFDGSGSTDNLDVVNYGIVNYTWTFTDNTTQVLTDVKANYTFYNIGNFSVTLNVSDYSGNWDTDEMWVNVT